MPAIASHAHDDGAHAAPRADGLHAAARDADVREALSGPSKADARESLVYWRARLDGLPRRQRTARREARAMVVAWEQRVRNAELERWGGGWLGRAAGGIAVLRTVGAGVAVRRLLRVLVPGKLVVGVLTILLGMTLLAGLVLGALLAALL
jgi:hypothetical protein